MSNDFYSVYSGSELAIRTTQEFNEDIIRMHPLSIRYFPFMQRQKDLALLAVEINGLARFWLDPSLREDPEIAALAEKNMPTKFSATQPLGDDNHRIFSVDLLWTRPLRNVGTYNELNYCRRADNTCSPFLRDSHVVLFSTERLIPYTIKNPNYHELLAALVPPTGDQFIIGKKMEWAGNGFCEKNTDQAMIMAYDDNISFRRAKTCIEGGNCFLFKSKGIQKAIIGELSLYLSLIALLEQEYFIGLPIQISEELTDEDFRRARNISLHTSGNWNPAQPELYRAQLVAPVSEEDRSNYAAHAKHMHFMVEVTKKCIAEDLEIPIEHVIFIPQTEFHIDTELCVTPQDEVILHDPLLAQEFFEYLGLQNLDPDEVRFLEAYKNTNAASLKVAAHPQEVRKKILEDHGIRVHLLPAVFEALELNSLLNYCNGIFLEKADGVSGRRTGKTLFVTTGPSFKEEVVFHEHFVKYFQQKLPDIELKDIPNMSQFMATHTGGIRCLTTESSPFLISNSR